MSPNVAGFPSEAERVAGLKALIPIANGNCRVSVDPGKIDLAAAKIGLSMLHGETDRNEERRTSKAPTNTDTKSKVGSVFVRNVVLLLPACFRHRRRVS